MDIYSAAILGNVDEIKSILAEKPELVNARDQNGYTPLHFAITSLGNEKAVKLLVDNGADINARENHMGATPLHFAVDKGPKEIVEFLILRGADINARDKIGGTALHHLVQADQKDSTDKIEFLLSKGADINAKDIVGGGTPLHYASLNGYINIVRFLIDKGADITCQGKDGVTALSLAEHEGHKDVADLLRKHMKEIRDLLSSIEETGYNDKRVIVLTERLKKNAPELNKKLGEGLKQDCKFDWYSAVMLGLKMAEQMFRALEMLDKADQVSKAIDSLELAWSESDLHSILKLKFYNEDIDTVLKDKEKNMSEEERKKLNIDIAPVKVLSDRLIGISWSDDPSCFERHLQRKYRNPLFPADKRNVTQHEVDLAKQRDDKDATELFDEYKKFMDSIANLPSQASVEECVVLIQKIDKLIERYAEIGGSVGREAIAKLSQLRKMLANSTERALIDNNAQDILNKLREAEQLNQSYTLLYNNTFLAQMHRKDTPIIPEDVVPALLSEGPDTISTVMKTLGNNRNVIRQGCIQFLNDAKAGGTIIPQLDEKLSALGHE